MVFALTLSACGGKNQKTATTNFSTDSIMTNDTLNELRIDSVRLSWLKDNAGERLMPRTLFPDAPDSLIDSLGLQDGIPASVGTFLVETNGCLILFDTGNGTPDSRLLPELKRRGISPADIRYLYLTHFHGDHIGGMMQGDSVVFPNAEVYASQMEYDGWMNMPEERKAQVVKIMEAYKERLHLFNFDDVLPGNVTALNAVGHTPGHTAFQVGRLFIVGDLMHGTALQLLRPDICATFDMDQEAAAATRKRILHYAKENGLTLAGMHFPTPGWIKGEGK